jgi:hypothetical protein
MSYEVLKYSIVDDEIVNAFLYYQSISYNLTLRFETEIEKVFDKLEKNPVYYFILKDGKHRRILIEAFPYSLIYCIEDENVIVKILFPQKEDPAKLWAQLYFF